MCILHIFTHHNKRAELLTHDHLAHVYVGCSKVEYLLLHGVVCIFSHPMCVRAGTHCRHGAGTDLSQVSVWWTYLYIDVDVCILHTFTHPNKRAELLTPNHLVQVCVGCQKDECVLLHGVVCIFLHPMYVRWHELHTWRRCL